MSSWLQDHGRWSCSTEFAAFWRPSTSRFWRRTTEETRGEYKMDAVTTYECSYGSYDPPKKDRKENQWVSGVRRGRHCRDLFHWTFSVGRDLYICIFLLSFLIDCWVVKGLGGYIDYFIGSWLICYGLSWSWCPCADINVWFMLALQSFNNRNSWTSKQCNIIVCFFVFSFIQQPLLGEMTPGEPIEPLKSYVETPICFYCNVRSSWIIHPIYHYARKWLRSYMPSSNKYRAISFCPGLVVWKMWTSTYGCFRK